MESKGTQGLELLGIAEQCAHLLNQLYFIVMVGFMNAVSSGFDGSLMSGINDMKQYQNYVHSLPWTISHLLMTVLVSSTWRQPGPPLASSS